MLSIDSVSLNFFGKPILSGCYLDGKKGEVVGLLGRNGSGKSCLLKIIFGSMSANNMHLRINDKIVTKAFKTGLLSYLPQENFLPPFLKVGSLLAAMSAAIQSSDAWKSLLKCNHSRVNELSGGELKVLECLWILNQPSEYVLMDEPFAGIAPLQIELLQTVIQQEARNKCIIITDHVYTALLKITDRVFLLHNQDLYPIKNELDLQFYGYIPDLSHLPVG